MWFSSGLMAALIASHTAPGRAATFAKPDFETGDSSGWILFTHPGGLIGSDAFAGASGATGNQT